MRPPHPLSSLVLVLSICCRGIRTSNGFSASVPPASPPPPGGWRDTPRKETTGPPLGEDAVVPVPMDTPARRSLPPNLVLRPVPGKGLGVVALLPIPAGTAVGDYGGEMLTSDEKDRRYLDSHEHLRLPVDEEWRKSRIDRGQTLTGTYLYGVTVPKGGPPIYVDSEDEDLSLWTRFVNHSPAPNLNAKSIHESWDGKPRVWFVSNRDIGVGEELCFDYGDDYWLPGDEVV